MFRRYRQPWRSRREAGARGGILPGHRRAAAIPAFESRPKLLAVWILQLFKWHVGLGQSEFLALVDADRTAQGPEQRQQHRRRLLTNIVKAPAARHACEIVIRERPRRP